jgi:hypothetical protein
MRLPITRSPRWGDIAERFTPYTGPLYNRHGREVRPAIVSPYAGGPVRPCC